MSSGVRSRYHIAINGKGFMLRGAPDAPSYRKQEAPSLVNSLAIDEISYNQLNGSGWRHFAQTDWSGGFQRLKFKDDASFRSGQGIDTINEFGNVTLQHDFTSAVSISGSNNFGDSIVHDGDLILGSVKSGGASIYKITSAHTLTKLSAMTGISGINSMSRFGDDSLIGMTRPSGSVKTLSVFRDGAISGVRSTNHVVRAVKGIGIRAYISEKVTATSGDQLLHTTDLSTYTSAFNAGKNRQIPKIENLGGVPYFFVENAKQVQMYKWSELSEKAFDIYTFNDLTDWGVTNYLTFLIITGTSAGKSVAFAFNGARLWQIFDDQLQDSSFDFSKPFEFAGNLQTKGATWDGEFWFPGLYGTFNGIQFTPFSNFADRAYGHATSGAALVLGYRDTTKYQISGNIVSSNFGYKIGAVDKFVNSATMGFKPLASGETLELSYSTDEGSNFTSIGTASFANDGAISGKTFNIPSGFVTKTWLYKQQLVGGGTSTPTFQDVAFQYRALPDMKRRWNLLINAGNGIKLLNRQEEERDGKALMEELWLEKDNKRLVTFEDINYVSANIVSAMTASDTSARIQSTKNFPPNGRIRIVSAGVAEEITYTSAEGGFVKGLARGRKGTVARAYTSAHSIDNAYTVIVTDIDERINNTDENKTESIAAVALLEI